MKRRTVPVNLCAFVFRNFQTFRSTRTCTLPSVPQYISCTCANNLSSSAALSGKCKNISINTGRKKLVILGTGWGSYSVVRKANKKLYDVIVISPRNHFLFTPLLASTTVGTLEFRSIIEPIRNSGFRDEHHFHQSYATGLDPERQVVRCVSALDPGMSYEVCYDVLVIGVGAVPNDFNIPGVKEHAYFLKVQGIKLLHKCTCHN